MELSGITATEYVGYLASFMVLLSFMMKELKKLRLVNMTGCILFISYGFLMPSLRIGLPIIIANGAILAVNIYYLASKKS
ncbi:uroporphyrinogen decarboxylase [Winogradskyella sp. D23]|uniref:Uroporphyrinogen decarboxylase n=1 Tax=Winogradskyella alexanderae TaxID=2877123 RepID=A0ABS7XS74_9FLAO|nr:uroporphyrinogen decarboxylase [Winogradskyella alexanderae]MCA0132865.1 uroporphyrinogen decarboxylase [Winogradskyella alexanderae]